ncbi:MAG: 16S rRNA (cytosine(1402)-N(4))-methyltransferase RsmH [Gammaproteobacteria bacterium]|nr:16S rRNA (cytosine(1402)-N(4))-methyltransferase RsmH [Gammaproteobacteria bacterium]
MGDEYNHHPVLLEEALEALNIEENGIYIDGTFGRGGHAREILNRLGQNGQLIAIDKDPEAVRNAREQFKTDPRFSIERGSFAMLEQLVDHRGLLNKVSGLLLDLGVSSPQLDDPQRGFSFLKDGPLDMRMDPESGVSAEVWLATASEDEISRVLKTFGEERFHRRIARAITGTREESPIQTTNQLADIVSRAIPRHEKHKHPATRAFQAIRIFINHELEDVSQCLQQALNVLAVGGRMVVISFHSLEDRIVKRFIRDQSRGKPFPPDLPVRAEELQCKLKPVGKAIRAGKEEIARNPRARSAVMRVAERVA